MSCLAFQRQLVFFCAQLMSPRCSGPLLSERGMEEKKNKKEKPKNANVSVGAKLSFALFSSRALLLRATVICEVPRHRQDGVRQARLLME